MYKLKIDLERVEDGYEISHRPAPSARSKTMSRYIPLTAALSVAVVLIGCGSSIAQHSSPPAGWSEHKDAAGFAVDLPKGWIAETAKDRHLMFHSADSKEF